MNHKCEIASPACTKVGNKVVRGTHYCQPCKDYVMSTLMDQIEAEAKKAEDAAREEENVNQEGSVVRPVPGSNEQSNQ